MSRRRKDPKPTGYGESKHRKARVARFKARNPDSAKVACAACGKPRARCVCR